MQTGRALCVVRQYNYALFLSSFVKADIVLDVKADIVLDRGLGLNVAGHMLFVLVDMECSQLLSLLFFGTPHPSDRKSCAVNMHSSYCMSRIFCT